MSFYAMVVLVHSLRSNACIVLVSGISPLFRKKIPFDCVLRLNPCFGWVSGTLSLVCEKKLYKIGR